MTLTAGQRVDVLLKEFHPLEGRHEEEVTLYGDVEGHDGADDGRAVGGVGLDVLAGEDEVTVQGEETD